MATCRKGALGSRETRNKIECTWWTRSRGKRTRRREKWTVDTTRTTGNDGLKKESATHTWCVPRRQGTGRRRWRRRGTEQLFDRTCAPAHTRSRKRLCARVCVCVCVCDDGLVRREVTWDRKRKGGARLSVRRRRSGKWQVGWSRGETRTWRPKGHAKTSWCVFATPNALPALETCSP